jgi:Protein of unknown function (DUF2786)
MGAKAPRTYKEYQMVNPEELSKIKQRLTKLLALSASPIEAEAALAMEKCQELMDKYGIRTVDVDPVSKTCGVASSSVDSMDGDNWEKLLAYNIAKALDGTVITIPAYVNGRRTNRFSLCFIAGNTDIEIIMQLYVRLRRNIGAMAIKYGMDNNDHTKNTRYSYCHGVTIAVGKNLDLVYSTQPAPTSTDLVVIKKDAINARMHEMFPKIKNKSVKANIAKINADAFVQGICDGKSVGVHTGIIN